LLEVKKIFKLIVGILVGFLFVTNAFSANLVQADIKPLMGDDFSAKQLAIQKIISAPPDLAAKILQALNEENLFGITGDLIVIKTSNIYVDAITGDPIKVEESSLNSPSLNNLLRSDVESAASQFKLFSKDAKARSAAIDAMLSDYTQSKIETINKAIHSEEDASIKNKLEVLAAMVSYKGESKETKISLIKTLSSSSISNAEDFLKGLLKKDGTDNFIEQDRELRLKIELGLKEYQTRKSRAEIVANIFSGLSLGSILMLAALGLAITYGLIGVINMAHGEFLMVGAYATYLVQILFRNYFPDYVDAYLVIALPAAFCSSAIVGLLIEYLILRHLYGRPLETLLATFGVSLLLMQLVRLVFGAQNVEVANPAWMSGSLMPLQAWFPGLMIPYNRLIIFFFAIGVVITTWLVLNKTRLGLFVRAVTQNRSMAACVGIKTRKIDSYAFAFGAGIAGLGGCALSQIGNVGPDLGQSYIIDSFMAVVLGGVGQLAGTIVGALGLGILSKFSEPFIGAVLTKIYVLVLIILFIQKRPQGIFALKGRSAEA
jgi:urea transport system permease protein